MKKAIFTSAAIICLLLTGLQAQTNSYTFNGVKYDSNMGNGVWVGEIAVMNSADGSFQVYFKKIPTKSGKYKVVDHLRFTQGGTADNEVGVVLLTDAFGTQFWSVDPGKTSVSVKIKGSMMTIAVKNVKLCVHSTSNCKNITGQMNISTTE